MARRDHRGCSITGAHYRGCALGEGKPDELIRVQNMASQRIVEAIVRSAQLVEVSL